MDTKKGIHMGPSKELLNMAARANRPKPLPVEKQLEKEQKHESICRDIEGIYGRTHLSPDEMYNRLVPPWLTSKRGNPYCNVDGWNVVIFSIADKFRFSITEIATNMGELSDWYDSIGDAQQAALDILRQL